MGIGDFIRRLAGTESAVLPEDLEADRLFGAFLEESRTINRWYAADFTALTSAKPFLEAPPSRKLELLVNAAFRLNSKQKMLSGVRSMGVNDEIWTLGAALRQLISAMLRVELPFDAATLELVLSKLTTAESAWVRLPPGSLVRAVERFAAKNSPLTPVAIHGVERLMTSLKEENTAESRKLQNRLQLVLSPARTETIDLASFIERGEPWADAAVEQLSTLPASQQATWAALLRHAMTATASNPSKAWLSKAKPLVDAIGRDSALAALGEWMPLVGKPGPGRPMRGFVGAVLEPTVLSERNADTLKGLTWMLSLFDNATAARLLGDLAEVCFKKIPTHGARCPKVANAALAALSLMNGPEPVAQITRIAAKARKPSIRKIVDRALSRSADSQGVTPDELEEMSVPDFGLDPSGVVKTPVGDITAEMAIQPGNDASLKWRLASGKLQATIPAEIKRDHADALAGLKRNLKDLQRVLPTQAVRLERLLLTRRTWPMEVWLTRYANHAMVRHFARRLIWESMGDQPFMLIDGHAIDAAGTPIELAADKPVRLWHPIDSPPEVTLAWRRLLVDRQIVQPFKQAHREIYLLTDAELTTRTYSNRFAAHVLRQHQFKALCDARGWTYSLMGGFDSHNTPTRKLPDQHLAVEFWVDSAGEAAADMTSAGIFLHIVTDQVRFCSDENREAVPLDQIPPIVFSELMRDVDLFVGVASVGNDPTWQDNGANGRFAGYWHNYSFGDLSETAKTRRAVLEGLLPRLTKLRDRWKLEDKFLVIRGQLRTYKIHLGSGNILMEPNDQYLCIVPDRSSAKSEGVFLPFEGDSTLSVILSKAFLLADDGGIKDPTITRQIDAGRPT